MLRQTDADFLVSPYSVRPSHEDRARSDERGLHPYDRISHAPIARDVTTRHAQRAAWMPQPGALVHSMSPSFLGGSCGVLRAWQVGRPPPLSAARLATYPVCTRRPAASLQGSSTVAQGPRWPHPRLPGGGRRSLKRGGGGARCGGVACGRRDDTSLQRAFLRHGVQHAMHQTSRMGPEALEEEGLLDARVGGDARNERRTEPREEALVAALLHARLRCSGGGGGGGGGG